MEINLRVPKVPRVPYFLVSVMLDVLAAGIGVLAGAENAMLAVKSKRGVESFVRKSAERIAGWVGSDQPELAPFGDDDTAEERGRWNASRYTHGGADRFPGGFHASGYERSGLPFPDRW
jgi:hypothetical protein